MDFIRYKPCGHTDIDEEFSSERFSDRLDDAGIEHETDPSGNCHFAIVVVDGVTYLDMSHPATESGNPVGCTFLPESNQLHITSNKNVTHEELFNAVNTVREELDFTTVTPDGYEPYYHTSLHPLVDYDLVEEVVSDVDGIVINEPNENIPLRHIMYSVDDAAVFLYEDGNIMFAGERVTDTNESITAFVDLVNEEIGEYGWMRGMDSLTENTPISPEWLAPAIIQSDLMSEFTDIFLQPDEDIGDGEYQFDTYLDAVETDLEEFHDQNNVSEGAMGLLYLNLLASYLAAVNSLSVGECEDLLESRRAKWLFATIEADGDLDIDELEEPEPDAEQISSGMFFGPEVQQEIAEMRTVIKDLQQVSGYSDGLEEGQVWRVRSAQADGYIHVSLEDKGYYLELDLPYDPVWVGEVVDVEDESVGNIEEVGDMTVVSAENIDSQVND